MKRSPVERETPSLHPRRNPTTRNVRETPRDRQTLFRLHEVFLYSRVEAIRVSPSQGKTRNGVYLYSTRWFVPLKRFPPPQSLLITLGIFRPRKLLPLIFPMRRSRFYDSGILAEARIGYFLTPRRGLNQPLSILWVQSHRDHRDHDINCRTSIREN